MKTQTIPFILTGLFMSVTVMSQQPTEISEGRSNRYKISTVEVKCDNNNITDIDGNVYRTVKIGSQTWMAENLKTTRFNDDSPIPLVTNNMQWQYRKTPAYCWINNDEVVYKNPYGALYNWYAVNTNILCPVGWHIPNNADWNALANTLGGRSLAGGKMKEIGTTHWSPPNIGATNESGFSALPGCLLDPSMSTFYPIGNWVIWWNSTLYNEERACFNTLQYDQTDLVESYQPKEWGFSVRCVQHINSVPSLTTNFVTCVTDNSAICGGNRCADYDPTITACGVCWSTNSIPTINDNKTTDDIGTFDFISQINGLRPNNKYYVRAYAINNIGVGYGNEYSFKTMNGKVTDIEGNDYKTVIIGSQIWMAENLRTTRYNDNTPILNIADYNEWNKMTTGVYCWFNNNSTYREPYGALYNWYSVNSEKLCPVGWHVPDDSDWYILSEYLGGESVAGGKIMECGAGHWQTNTYGTNESGFTALPAGYPGSGISNMDIYANWWSNTQDGETKAWNRGVSNASTWLFRDSYIKSTGFSIRCLKDTENTTEPVELHKGLVAYYPFNGNANDESGYNHDGVVYGATLSTDRFSNPDKAYYFNGQGNSIAINNFNIPSDSVTITCWVKVMSPAVSQIFISKNHGPADVEILMKSINNRYTIEWTIGGFYFTLTDDQGYFIIDPYQPEFAFLTLRYDGRKVDFFVNNQLVASRNTSGKIAKSTYPMVFGRFAAGINPENFNGALDDIRIFDRVLNKAEIQALYSEYNNQSFLPEISTVAINNITATTAYSGGVINQDGGSEIFLRGVCWSTSTDPDTADFKTSNKCSADKYISLLTDLQPNTYYFVKAYAINHTGIGYGNQLSFKTLEDGSVNLQNGLVAYYPFNGDARDESRNQFSGIVQRATLSSDRFGSNNSSYEFDTNNATIKLPNAVLNDFQYSSISLWVYWLGEKPSIILAKQHDYVDSYYIFGIGMYNGGGGLGFGDPGRVYFRVKNGSLPIQSNSLLESNKWNHLVINVGLDITLYINGILDNRITGSDYALPYDINATTTNLGVWLQDSIYDGVMNGKLDDIRIYNRVLNASEIQALYNENVQNENISIHTPAISALRDSTFQVSVIADNIKTADNAIAYQFDYNFEPQKMQYLNYSTTSTLSEEGIMGVNPVNNKLSVAWAGHSSFSGSGTLVNLQFIALETGTTTPLISNFLLNTDTIWNIENGSITIQNEYGDVDDNNYIQAYDAALALQYSVGLDPLPDIDPLPWEEWRITVANVDGQNGITAYDASMILQYVPGIINTFPVEDHEKSFIAPRADVNISLEDGFLVFRSEGKLYSLNVTVNKDKEILGNPQFSANGALTASRISETVYAIGLAVTQPLGNDDIFMKIPFNDVTNQRVTFDMIINTEHKQLTIGPGTGIDNAVDNSFAIYPNPNDGNFTITLGNEYSNVTITITELDGRIIQMESFNNAKVINLKIDAEPGIYMVIITTENNRAVFKIMKK